jgi:hypothetical protein
MALRDAGARIVNLACGLGRPEQRVRREAELREACARARFELILAADDELTEVVAGALRKTGAGVVAGPSPHDAHPAHEAASRAITAAVEAIGEPRTVAFWGLWADLAEPNLVVPFGEERLAELRHALAAHAGELARNRYDRLLEARAAANAILGPERVHGFGSPGIDADYAELLRVLDWNPRTGWEALAPASASARLPLG